MSWTRGSSGSREMWHLEIEIAFFMSRVCSACPYAYFVTSEDKSATFVVSIAAVATAIFMSNHRIVPIPSS